MDNTKDNIYYIQKIIADLSFVVDHTKELTQKEFETNELLIDSVMFRLIQVSENSSKLTDDFKAHYTFIPWRAIRGLRNRIVHEYGNVELGVVYDTVQKDIPDLLNELKMIL